MKFADSTTVVPVNGAGPEDVVVDDAGRIYTGLEDGRIIRIADGGKTIETIAECPGRPLGVELYGDDELVVCASDAGLLAVSVTTGEARTLADTVFDTPIMACNNAAVAKDGTIYFSDSSRRFPIPQWRKDLIEQTRTGRLLRLNTNGTVDELMTGLHFANGVALAADESFVTVAESGGRGLQRMWLTGERAGGVDTFVEDLSGYPDNSSTGSDGLIWVAIPAPRNPALSAVQRMPGVVRSVVTSLPESVQPGPARTVAAVGIDADGAIVRRYEGEIGEFSMLTGIRERDGVLYFGSLTASGVAVMPGNGRR